MPYSAHTNLRRFSVALLIFCGSLAGCGVNGGDSASVGFSSGDSVPGSLSPSPDGRYIALDTVQSGRRNVGLIGLDGSGPALLTHGEWEYDPAYSPDGNSIAFCGAVADNPNQIFVMDATGGSHWRITNARYEDSSPSFSPDGTKIAFIRSYRHRPYSMGGWTWDDMDVCVMNAGGSGLRRLTSQTFYSANSPHFSPDGHRIVFRGCPAGNTGWHIYLVEAATGTIHQLTSGAPEDFDPSFSPDGKRIVFASRRASGPAPPSGSDVWTMDLHGGHLRRMTHLEGNIQSPRYLPGGSGIVFSVVQPDDVRQDIWVVDTSGKNARRIAGPL
jgi:TolB protein